MGRIEQVGAQGILLHKLVDLVANSSAFQSRCAVTTAIAAERKIHWPACMADELELRGMRPFAVVEQMPVSWKKAAAGVLVPLGACKLSLTDNDNLADDFKLSSETFQIFIDGTIRDVLKKFSTDDRFTGIEVVQTLVPSQNDPTNWASEGRWWIAQYQINWNPLG